MKTTLTQDEVNALLHKYEEMIPEKYSKNNFPKNFSLRPIDWAFTQDEIAQKSIDTIINESKTAVRPLLIMDVEFLSNVIVEKAKTGEIDLVKNYPCGLKCPGCFSEERIYDDRENLMTWQQVMNVIDQGKKVGLKGIKFLGPGELFQNPDLFDILDALQERDIPISIFTKGAELGDDNLARQVYSNEGIQTAIDLTNRIAKYDGVRILLGFNSFSSERQDWMVGSLKKLGDYTITDGKFTERGISNYTTKRDKALVNLVNAGFSEGKQKLSLIATPVFYYQSDEIPAMYLWAAQRNIPLIIAPTMESGPKSLGLQKANSKIDPEHEQLIDLMTSVYIAALDNGIMTMDTIRTEGVSAYMGTSPCNQVANGLFMRLNGQIQMCPGKSDNTAIYGNIHDKSLAEIWINSPNYAMGPKENNWCTAKTSGMPTIVQNEVLKRLEEYVAK
ncbi:MAG: SPASM domain-containing protein [Candidatus Woesearchaeota archaeon]